MHRTRRIAPGAAALGPLACVGTPEELLISYEEALARAEVHQDPDYQAALGDALIDPMIDGVEQCKLPTGSTPGIVLAIGADGQPDAVYVDPPTRENKCLRRYLRFQARFPEPPFAPFFATP